MLQKTDYLKNVNFVIQKIAIFRVLNVNFYSAWLFFEVLLLFNIPYIYRVLFCAFLSWLKNCLSGERRISNKKIIRLFKLSKKITVYIRNKNWISIFPTVVEKYRKILCKKIGEKFIQNPPGNKEKHLTFSYWRFFCDLMYTP